MEPVAKHGIDILFPASVMYSLYLMTDDHTESTAKKRTKILSKFGIFECGNTKMLKGIIIVFAVGEFDISL